MSTNQQNKEEEVDLGSLFIIIGNGFKKFFNFIGKIFTGIFHFLILILLFIKENMIKLGIAAIIGGVLGGYLQYSGDKVYGSDLLVKPNFESARQLYQNIDFYNELVTQGEYKKFGEIFGIDSTTASTIRSFQIRPIKRSNDIVESYDELILSIDTTTIKSFEFLDFKKAFTDYDYQVHEIHVESTNNRVFPELDEVIISSVEQNAYYKKIKELKKEDLFRSDSILRKNLMEVDSLRKIYNKVMLDEAKKETQGTNIGLTLSEGKEQLSKELELFKTSRNIDYQLKVVSEEISEKTEIINVVSNFQPVGYEIKELSRNKMILFAGFAMVLVSGFILLLRLNKFLDGYKNK